MGKIEELEEETYCLQRQRDDVEDKMRQIECMQEEEDYNMLCSYRKLSEAWENYGKNDAEFAALLEEEKELLDKYKVKFAEHEEQIRNEYNKELQEIDRKTDDIRIQINHLENQQEKG